MLTSAFNFIITNIIYRPFLNALVLFYQWLPWGPDMGLALIIFTIFINICLLPLSARGESSEEEKQELLNGLKRIEETFAGYPIRIKKEKDKLIRVHRKVIWSRYFSYAVYICYFLILYRVFKTGLKGDDLDLLYSFVPKPATPLNLKLLGGIELTEPNPWFNAVSALLTIPAELLGIIFSDFPPTKEDWLMVIFAPLAAFFITYRIPSGQELFFTISLLFAMVVMITRQIFKVVIMATNKK
ncbi:hypothetical protein B5M47_01425 [candidate division CPR3 bacterium 4484_211]|uniref:Membrane insertase YidC/Oxa/ALB C-terminal domain-containing protein n=1 Tax=candidate division CPR3 bacterium 4484_211 TaxID=1968527 RepID=A0A1W9NYK9_UNCC3|nr:MAG: hypothetical protein B5M47_01425 [candidate division CPR3 bacterium 4484_211]